MFEILIRILFFGMIFTGIIYVITTIKHNLRLGNSWRPKKGVKLWPVRPLWEKVVTGLFFALLAAVILLIAFIYI